MKKLTSADKTGMEIMSLATKFAQLPPLGSEVYVEFSGLIGRGWKLHSFGKEWVVVVDSRNQRKETIDIDKFIALQHRMRGVTDGRPEVRLDDVMLGGEAKARLADIFHMTADEVRDVLKGDWTRRLTGL